MALLEDTFPEPISLLHRYVGDYYHTYDLMFSSVGVFPFIPALPKITSMFNPPNTNRMYVQRIRPLHYSTEFDWLNAYRNYLLSIRDKIVINITPNTGIYTPKDLKDYKIDDIEWDAKFESDRDGAIHYIVSHGGLFYGYHRQLIFEGTNKLAYPLLINSLIIEVPYSVDQEPARPILTFSNSSVERWIYADRFNLPTFSNVSEDLPIDKFISKQTTVTTATSNTSASPVNTGRRVKFNWTCGTASGNCQVLEYQTNNTTETVTTELIQEPIPTLPRIKDISIIRGTNNKYGQEPLQDIGFKPKLFAAETSKPNSKFLPVILVFDEAQATTFGYKFVYDSDIQTQRSYSEGAKATYFQCFFGQGAGSGCSGWGGQRLEYITSTTGSSTTTNTVTRSYVLDPRPEGQRRVEITDASLLDPYWLALSEEDPLCLENVEMPDSPRLMEIHAALRADLYGQTVTDQESGEEVPRKTNLAWHIASLCKMFGINYDKNGKNQMVQTRGDDISERRPIRVIPGTADDPRSGGVTIDGILPFGCVGFTNDDLETGELSGVNPDSVNSYPQWVYKVKSRQFRETEFGSTEIQPGDYIVCYTMQQFVQTIMQDLDKAIGMEEAGANAIPNADGSDKICTYEGLGQLVAENAFMLSAMSRQTSQSLVSNLVVQGIALELLKATGYPLDFGEVKAKIAGLSDVSIPYPKLADNSPTINSQVLDILNNLGPLVANLLCPAEESDVT